VDVPTPLLLLLLEERWLRDNTGDAAACQLPFFINLDGNKTQLFKTKFK